MAYEQRFTESSINRLQQVEKVLSGSEITNLDYSELLTTKGQGVFIFLDPPYYSAKKSKLYGNGGCNHINFDYNRFANDVKQCNHLFMITLDDDPYIRSLFRFANIFEWSLQYGMNNVGAKKAARGKELLITNFDLPSYQLEIFYDGVFKTDLIASGSS